MIKNINWGTEFNGMNANQMYEVFIAKYNQAVDQFIPKFTASPVKQQHKPQPKWFNKEIKECTKLKYKLWKKN